MRKIKNLKRKMIRYFCTGICLSSVAFVFQACYGTGPANSYSVKLTGTVRSKTTNLPIKGIKISVNDRGNSRNNIYNCGFTDENGKFEFYATVPSEYFYDYEFDRDSTLNYRYTYDSVYVHFRDIDSIENGLFEDKTIIIAPAYKNEVKISVELEEKP